MERERFGGGRSGGINRYPDVSGRTGGNAAPPPPPSRGPREERGFGRRDERPREAAPRVTSSAEPWSEVPPELEAMLRAQVGQQPSPAAEAPRPTEPEQADVVTPIGADETPAPKRRTTRKPAASTASTVETEAGETPAPKRRATRKTAANSSPETASTDASASVDADAEAAPAPKRRTTRKPAASAADSAPVDAAASDAPPKRRTTRKTATSSSDPA